MPTAELFYDDVPPSMNASASGYKGHWGSANREKKKWQAIWSAGLMVVQMPRCRRVEAEAVLRFPIMRRRDEGNYRMLLEKSLGDALQERFLIPDDTPEYFSFKSVRFSDERGPKRTEIYLTYEPEDEDGTQELQLRAGRGGPVERHGLP